MGPNVNPLATWLRRIADKIDPAGAPKSIGYSFTFDQGIGITFHNDRRVGCPLWYYGEVDYSKAHADDLVPPARNETRNGQENKTVVTPTICRLVSPAEGADLLGVTRQSIYNWIRDDRLPAYKVGRLVRIKREDLEAFATKRSNSG